MADKSVAALTARIRRFAESGDRSAVLDPAALEEATALWEAARPADGTLQAIPVSILTVLAYLHLLRYQIVAEGCGQGDLQNAFMLFGVLMDQAHHRVPDDIRDLLAVTNAKQIDDVEGFAAAVSKYQQTGHSETVDQAITAFRGMVAITGTGHPDHAGWLSELAGAIFTRFIRRGDGADLDAAIDVGQQAVAATPPRHPSLAKHLSNLGVSLGRRFGHAGNAADLEAAIDVTRRAVALTPSEDPDLAWRLSSLGNSLLSRFKREGDRTDLDSAIDAGQQGVAATSRGDPNRATIVSNLGNALLTRFEQVGDSADLDAAIGAEGEALADTPPDDPNRAVYLSNLGNCLAVRFEQTGDIADLDTAIAAVQQAVALTPPGHPDFVGPLAILGGMLLTRFEHTGDSADLNAAIDAGQQAAARSLPGDPDRGGPLSNLANALVARFEQTGDSADLDAAIEVGRKAVTATPPGDRNRGMYLSNLGSSLSRRFERDQDFADLNAAVEVEQQAVTATPPGHPARANYLSNLGNSLVTRFRHTGDNMDLDAAVDAEEQAVAAMSPGHPNLAAMLSNLAASLAARFHETRHRADVDAAIDAMERAVATTPPGHAARAMYLANLGNSFLARFWRDGDSNDLDAAISYDRQAIAATSSSHPDRAAYLSNLGICLQARYEHSGDRADLDAAIGYWQQASQVAAGRPTVRLAAARSWGVEAADAGRMRQAADGFAAAVGLLPTVAWHGLDRATRQEQLAQWVGLAADAAACAVLVGRPEYGVELLEQGRSVLWAQALNLRSDLSRLAEKDPSLAERLDSIRRLFDAPVPTSALEADDVRFVDAGRGRQSPDSIELRRRMAREWDEALIEVRDMDGFEHFLAATPYPELAATPVGGPVVIVNASYLGCHALIVNPGTTPPRVVDLGGLSLNAAVDHANQMLAALADTANPQRTFRDREKDRHTILEVLEWLWDVIAEPVLTVLEHTAPPKTGDPWPRVWWCPTGPLNVLPIHAAGHHPRHRTSNRNIDSVLDRVISSYTPTLAALTRASQPAQPAGVRQLTVGMPETPRLQALPAVPEELEVVARYFPLGELNRRLIGPQATRTAVLTAMAGHSWVHLACHAGQQQADPDRSGFALWDDTLTITELASAPTQRRDLAFLSACETAAGSIRHLDEAIHLAAAMQFLGYRHVIATMWTIADPPAPHVADNVYRILTQGGRPDPGRAAEALHGAIHSLRRIDPTNPLLWAPYIHLGA